MLIETFVSDGRAVKNKYHKPSSDGCGSLGLEVSVFESTVMCF